MLASDGKAVSIPSTAIIIILGRAKFFMVKKNVQFPFRKLLKNEITALNNNT